MSDITLRVQRIRAIAASSQRFDGLSFDVTMTRNQMLDAMLTFFDCMTAAHLLAIGVTYNREEQA